MWHDREDGAALVMAMLATLVIAGLVAVMANRAVTETRVTASARDRETAIHVAEAGIDNVIVEVNELDEFITRKADGATKHQFDLPLNATQAEERAWALALASDPDDCVVVATQGGEACGIRPVHIDTTTGAETELPWIYGVGFVPNRANAEKTRVVKIQFDKGFFSPAKAILTGPGRLEVGATICGVAADVHSNGDVKVLGGADLVNAKGDCPGTVDGSVTSTGSFTQTGGDIGDRSGQVNGSVTVPEVDARTVYRREARRVAGYATDSQTITGNYDGHWFDLCPDGSVHRPTFDSSGDPAPCSDTTHRLNPDAAVYVGWSLSNQGWDVDRSELVKAGVYYIVDENAKIRGGSGLLNFTVLAQADVPCGTTNAGKNGNLEFNGMGNGGEFRPYLQDLLFLADRDVSATGNSDSDIHGVIAAHEQINLGGTVNYHAAVIAEDACVHSTGSPVSENKAFGNFKLTHNGDMALPLDSLTRITAWNEL